MKQFIGKKQIKEFKATDERTPGDIVIMEVIYEDDTVEHFSKIMFDKVVTTARTDDTELREKRIKPVLESVLFTLREWGVKVGELSYMSTLLNQSLDFNTNSALLKLISKYTPDPKSLDDIDLLIVDKILKDNGHEPSQN